MKNIIFISIIIIVLFETGNVFSNNNIFSVNNIEINKDNSVNSKKLVNDSFQKAFNELINRLLLEGDYKKISNTELIEIKKLISYYQIINPKKEDDRNTIIVNVFFDKDKMHDFSYNKKILYSDLINNEVILFPLLKKEQKYFVYSQNYFYENWNKEKSDDLIQYTLSLENIENIQKIKLNIDSIYKLNISNFFKEYITENIVFVNIEINNKIAKIFLKTRIEGKEISKSISIEKNKDFNEKQFNDFIILKIKKEIKDLIKSQNLIDVRTPSFLNVEINLKNKSNLVEFQNRIESIDLIDNFYVQKLNKNYGLIKIKYLGKIDKIINKLKKKNVFLKMKNGQWLMDIKE